MGVGVGVGVVTVTGVITVLLLGMCDPGTAIMTVAVKLPAVAYVCVATNSKPLAT